MDSSSEESKDKTGSDLLSHESLSAANSSDNTSSAHSQAQLGWPIRKTTTCLVDEASNDVKAKTHLSVEDASKLNKQVSKFSELEMMKERFAKLLLGEDMSGSGKGVSPALAISNAITNLCASVFGQLWRLEPLPFEKKSMWQREMEWLLCVSDHIVEMIPHWQTLPDGTKLEVMTCQPRSDLVINLPALRKLDNMLLEILDGFTSTEFWYVDHGLIAQETENGSGSFRKGMQRQEEKWWLPVPRVPPGGLPEAIRTHLIHKRECAGQILKAAVSINTIALSEMDVPDSYLESLPKNGRTCLGDVIYRYITSEHFSSECLLDCLDLSSEHVALEIANRVEAAIYVWKRRQHLAKPPTHPSRPTAKTSWEMVKDLMIDGGDKRELFAERAESLLQCLKHRFPGLTQTTLDASKIQCNKDVGKSILESYSRVLESLAHNITSRIDDLLYVDDISKQSDNKSSSNTNMLNVVPHKKIQIPLPLSASGTPYRTAYTSPSFSPAPLTSPSRTAKTPFVNGCSNKPPRRGLGVKRVLTNYLIGDSKVKNCSNALEGIGSVSNRATNNESCSRLSLGSKDPSGRCNVSRHQALDR